jgi:hypothetical protein
VQRIPTAAHVRAALLLWAVSPFGANRFEPRPGSDRPRGASRDGKAVFATRTQWPYLSAADPACRRVSRRSWQPHSSAVAACHREGLFYQTNPLSLPVPPCRGLSSVVSFCPILGRLTPYFYSTRARAEREGRRVAEAIRVREARGVAFPRPSVVSCVNDVGLRHDPLGRARQGPAVRSAGRSSRSAARQKIFPTGTDSVSGRQLLVEGATSRGSQTDDNQSPNHGDEPSARPPGH